MIKESKSKSRTGAWNQSWAGARTPTYEPWDWSRSWAWTRAWTRSWSWAKAKSRSIVRGGDDS